MSRNLREKSFQIFQKKKVIEIIYSAGEDYALNRM